jgi:UDP-N-acetyl-D-galactosamine dehydrogenase
MKKHLKLGLKKNFKKKIAIIGVGYVGLPLAKSLSKYYRVNAFDTNKFRIKELKKGIDRNLEFKKKELLNKNLKFTSLFFEIKDCNVYIITLPTPIDKKKIPDISLVINATSNLAKIIKKNDLIIYESTFYPGTIEEELIPILEKYSKLKYNKDFFIGYSPERINPGEKIHTLENVKKVIASNNVSSLKNMREIYNKIIKAGTYKASSIKVAELSKVIENTQRFVNISLMNELSTLCNKLNIQTKEVIDTASSKWNFMKYYPGFVGGHCVAVDPLYFSYKQKKFKIKSHLVDAADRINETKHLEIINELKNKFNNLKDKKILILGATFKENCPDIRNSGVIKLLDSLNKKKVKLFVHDPFIKKSTFINETKSKFMMLNKLQTSNYDCVIIAVAHSYYKKIGFDKIKKISNKKSCLFFDLKSIFSKDKVDFQF